MDISTIVQDYDPENITIGVLGGHSALDVCRGAKKHGFRTVAVCQKGREKTYSKYYKTRKLPSGCKDGCCGGDCAPTKGCVDEIILVDKFADIVKPEVQKQLRDMNTVFIHNRYFWVYCDFEAIENEFRIPIYGNRELVKLEERDQPNNQYVLLEKAGIRIPKIIRTGNSGMSEDETRDALNNHFNAGGGPVIVKVNEATRSYERAFFIVDSQPQYFRQATERIEKKEITQEDLDNSVIEEFILGAQINFNLFYSPLTDELELMGMDTRRQTNLDGFLRLDAGTQMALINQGVKPSMIETGHIACTSKESIVEKAYEAGEKFVETLKKEVAPGMIGPFALQGAMAAENGREEFVVFDVSMRIPGSPGTRFTPYSGYLYEDSISYGERIAMEVKQAVAEGRLVDILT